MFSHGSSIRIKMCGQCAFLARSVLLLVFKRALVEQRACCGTCYIFQNSALTCKDSLQNPRQISTLKYHSSEMRFSIESELESA